MKTIKFNLILDDKPVRNIEQLRENFSVEDILETYKNGLLKRWLKVRNYNEYLNKIEELNETNDKEIIKSLINIFDMYVDEEELEKIMNVVDYINTKKVNEYIAIDLDSYEFNVEAYHKGYEKLIDSILENKDNIGKLKAIFEEIDEKYINLFKMNYKEIYSKLNNDSISSLLIMLSLEKLKNILLSDNDIIKDLDKLIQNNIVKSDINNLNYTRKETIYTDKEIEEIKRKYKNNVISRVRNTQGFKDFVEREKVIILGVYNKRIVGSGFDVNLYDFSMEEKYCSNESVGKVLNGLYIETGQYNQIKLEYILYSDVYPNENIESSQSVSIDKNIKIYNETTEGYWKEIEDKNKQIMIIDIDENAQVKSPMDDKVLIGKDLKGKFKVIKGLEYNSNSTKPLIYMEV